MTAILTRMFGGMIVGLCIFSGIFLSLTLAVTLRLMPRLLTGLRTIVWAGLIASYRLYAWLFNIATQGRYQDQLPTGAGILVRSLICAAISLSIGAVLLLAVQLHFNAWWLGLFAIHGVFVGLFWNEIPKFGDFRLGDRIE